MLYILIRGSNFIVDWVIAVHLACTKERVFNRVISGVYNRNSHSMSLLRTKIFDCNPGTHSRHIPKTKGIRYTSTQVSQKCAINPWFFTGFSDGESSFTVRIFKSKTSKIGWTIQPVFQIGLHKKDLDLLIKIQEFLGVGEIYHKEESSNYIYNKDKKNPGRLYLTYGLIAG